MNTLESKTVADLVTENIQTAHVFKKYGIDFCCGGGISVKRAAEKAAIRYEDLEKDLLGVENTTGRTNNYNSWKLDFLTDHIINVHHAYVQENIPLIYQYALRVVRVHGSNYPELVQIQRLFSEISRELRAHLKKEEEILFPFIKKMVKAKKEGTDFSPPDFGTVDNRIKMMETEHEEAGGILRQISALSNKYIPPQEACNTFRAFYAKLEEFEQDLHQHVHLENNILFPKALNLEKKLSVV
ncbi:iron-sulfur cluster repair di-iron protein [Salinimicrobium marinum]|uniref:Iron-sulfur cluster repair di-iron protein n=1 Tax=Salinimicrobium marinum TaxID=680283 RepID=A0A918SJ28_9FLAO|nr:iron-sulfur cluster repair di-iron protein [Salinimicrobium marinum]GHA46747.1 iron-sulfur cluster repair di-iron protein [Salinimicrobium marinum]